MATKRPGSDAPPPEHGELRSGPIAGTAIISGATFSGKGVQYAAIDGEAANSRHARRIRTAISPRLAMRILRNIFISSGMQRDFSMLTVA